jgi:hypothetical protein
MNQCSSLKSKVIILLDVLIFLGSIFLHIIEALNWLGDMFNTINLILLKLTFQVINPLIIIFYSFSRFSSYLVEESLKKKILLIEKSREYWNYKKIVQKSKEIFISLINRENQQNVDDALADIHPEFRDKYLEKLKVKTLKQNLEVPLIFKLETFTFEEIDLYNIRISQYQNIEEFMISISAQVTFRTYEGEKLKVKDRKSKQYIDFEFKKDQKNDLPKPETEKFHKTLILRRYENDWLLYDINSSLSLLDIYYDEDDTFFSRLSKKIKKLIYILASSIFAISITYLYFMIINFLIWLIS